MRQGLNPYHLALQVSKWPRGKGLGGCSSHFGAAHVRGSRFDYDLWDRELGPKSGWSFNDVLPYFKKCENARNVERLSGKTDLHGFHGPIKLTDTGLSKLAATMVEAAKRLGYPWRDDINLMGGEEDQEGMTVFEKGPKLKLYVFQVSAVSNAHCIKDVG